MMTMWFGVSFTRTQSTPASFNGFIEISLQREDGGTLLKNQLLVAAFYVCVEDHLDGFVMTDEILIIKFPVIGTSLCN